MTSSGASPCNGAAGTTGAKDVEGAVAVSRSVGAAGSAGGVGAGSVGVGSVGAAGGVFRTSNGRETSKISKESPNASKTRSSEENSFFAIEGNVTGPEALG